MSTDSKLNQVLDSGQTVTVTFSNEKIADMQAERIQTIAGKIVSTNSPDVVEFRPEHGAPVPIPVTRILMIE